MYHPEQQQLLWNFTEKKSNLRNLLCKNMIHATQQVCCLPSLWTSKFSDLSMLSRGVKMQ